MANFTNAGNGGFFNVFEVPQLENEWKMSGTRRNTINKQTVSKLALFTSEETLALS